MPAVSMNKKSYAPSNVVRATKVFEEHGDFIHTIIHSNVKNYAEAEDLFQDLFLFLISKPIPEEVQNVRGFLYCVVSGKVKDAFRRIERYQGRIHRYAERRRRITENHPESIIIEVEETEKMFELIRKHLPTNEALAITLRHRNSCDTEEVAKKMGVKPRTISRYVSIGLKKIRQVLGVN